MTGKEIFWHALSLLEVEKELSANFKEGLKETEVKGRRRIFGFNALPEEKPKSQFRISLEQFKSPLIYILVIAGGVTLFLRDFADSIVIFGAVFLNVAIGFFQERKTSKILAELKKIVKEKAHVIREGNEKEIDASNLVPGDIFVLEAGSQVPADGRLIESYSLKINEAALTGEWLAKETLTDKLAEDTPLADRDNMVYMGTIIEEGKGKAVAVATASRTEIGGIAQLVKKTKEEKTPYQKKIIRFSRLVAFVILLFAGLIFISGILTGKNFLEMFTVSV